MEHSKKLLNYPTLKSHYYFQSSGWLPVNMLLWDSRLFCVLIAITFLLIPHSESDFYLIVRLICDLKLLVATCTYWILRMGLITSVICYLAVMMLFIISWLFVSSRFVNQILFTLPSVHGDFKTYCLEILCSRVEHIPKLFTELKERGLKEMLSQR